VGISEKLYLQHLNDSQMYFYIINVIQYLIEKTTYQKIIF